MHIKQLKKSSELLQRLEVLDHEIIQIEQFAMKVKDRSLAAKLTISYDKPKESAVRFDEDGSIIPEDGSQSFHFSYMSGILNAYAPKPKDKESFELTINEVITLQVLGVIVAHKEGERMAILSQLQGLGVTVEF